MSNSTIFVTLPSQRHSTISAELFINQTDKITLFSILRPEALFGNNALQLKSLDYYKGAAMAFLAAMCLAWHGIAGSDLLENPLPLFQLIVNGKKCIIVKGMLHHSDSE